MSCTRTNAVRPNANAILTLVVSNFLECGCAISSLHYHAYGPVPITKRRYLFGGLAHLWAD
jgi:hypothetical protein